MYIAHTAVQTCICTVSTDLSGLETGERITHIGWNFSQKEVQFKTFVCNICLYI